MISTLERRRKVEVPESPTDYVLRVRGLETKFFTHSGTVNAVNGVTFDLKRGERMAIVGESGSGKSVMAMSLLRLVSYPGEIVGGDVELNGRSILNLSTRELNAVRGREAAMVFQDPMTSLNPVMRVEDQIIPPMRRHLGMSYNEARRAGPRAAAAGGYPGRGVPPARVPARAQRRHAAAHPHRDGALVQAGPDPGGRADDGPGRDDPGPDCRRC